MNRVWLILVFVFLSIGLFGQYVPWSNLRHSSYTSQNTMDIRCESAAALFSELILSYKSGNTYTDIPMNSIENVTYGVTVPYTSGQNLHYLLKARRDSLVWLTPAVVTTTTFPPTIGSLSFIGSDPAGDSNVLNDNNMDITGTYFGYSDTKFYTAISNISGSFPTLAGLSGVNVYICGLINPEAALADSTLFAMVYVNVPFLYTPGIYKIKLSVTDFQFNRIGSCQTQVSGGKLFMSCNISDLTADATFGPWPNTTHILGFDVATISAGLSGTTLVPTIADWGPLTTLSFEDYTVPAYTNHLPVLSNEFLSPIGTNPLLTVTYTDEDFDFPLTAEVLLDNNDTIPMSTLLPVFSGSVDFSCNVPSSGWTNGTIRFSDNNTDIVTLPITLTGNEDVTSPSLPLLQIYPNPFHISANSGIDFQVMNKMNGTNEITIYNVKGQKVKHLISSNDKTGFIQLSWNGKDESGKSVAPGIYLSRLENRTEAVTKKFLILP